MQSLIFERIRRDLQNHDVVLYMKGTAIFPQCGFSAAVAQILTQLAIPFKDINVLEDYNLHEGLKHYSQWPRTPQLYVKGQFIGGCDVVREMYASRKLHALFEEHNLIASHRVA